MPTVSAAHAVYIFVYSFYSVHTVNTAHTFNTVHTAYISAYSYLPLTVATLPLYIMYITLRLLPFCTSS